MDVALEEWREVEFHSKFHFNWMQARSEESQHPTAAWHGTHLVAAGNMHCPQTAQGCWEGTTAVDWAAAATKYLASQPGRTRLHTPPPPRTRSAHKLVHLSKRHSHTRSACRPTHGTERVRFSLRQLKLIFKYSPPLPPGNPA